MDLTARLFGDLVRSILDEFEQLAVPITTLSDTSLAVRMLQDQARVHAIGFQHTRRLVDDLLDDGQGARTARRFGVVQSASVS